MKIYVENGDFILEQTNGTIYSSPKQDILITNAFPENAGVSYIHINNLEGWSNEAILRIEAIKNKDGITYSQRTFNQFLDILDRNQIADSESGNFYYNLWLAEGNEGTKEEFLNAITIRTKPTKENIEEALGYSPLSKTQNIQGVWAGSKAEFQQLDDTNDNILRFIKKE